MNIDALTSAPNPIPLHAVLALIAIVMGGLQLALPKGTLVHRSVGYLWVSTMFVVAVSSFFINEFRWVGPFGPIHLLSLVVLWSLWRGWVHAREQNIKAHRGYMVALYWQSLILAGAFTLLPERVMYDVVFA
ncbi:MAG: DUF2306 domain-containing protein [Pseudomonadota bacterium]